MKKIRLVIIALLVAITISGCSKPQEEKEKSFQFGKINSTEKFESDKIPNVSFYYYGNQIYTLNISEFKLNKYNITTAINGTQDTSDWVGIKMTDIIKTLNEDSTRISVYSKNGVMSRTYDNIDNLYILVERNNELIEFEYNNMVYMLADITKDASEWFYNFESIKGID